MMGRRSRDGKSVQQGYWWSQLAKLSGFEELEGVLLQTEYSDVIKTYDARDRRANFWAGFYRSGTKLAIGLVLSSALAAAVSGFVPAPQTPSSDAGSPSPSWTALLTPISVILLAAAFIVLLAVRFTGAHSKWREARKQAEESRGKLFQMLAEGKGLTGAPEEPSLLARVNFIHEGLVLDQITYNVETLKKLPSQSQGGIGSVKAMLAGLGLFAFGFSALWLIDQFGLSFGPIFGTALDTLQPFAAPVVTLVLGLLAFDASWHELKGGEETRLRISGTLKQLQDFNKNINRIRQHAGDGDEREIVVLVGRVVGNLTYDYEAWDEEEGERGEFKPGEIGSLLDAFSRRPRSGTE